MRDWSINLTTHEARHTSGLAVRFARDPAGGWSGEMIGEYPATLALDDAARHLREAGDAYKRSLQAERYLNHVTLTTGDTRRSYRHEVSDEAIGLCRDLLDDALDQPQIHTVIPRTNGCTMTATAHGRALIVTVWTPPVELRDSAPTRAPLVTFGVALDSKRGAKLWRLLHERYESQLATHIDECPAEPWVAARIEVGAAIMPEAMDWIGDFERCVAWAFLGDRA